MNVVREISRINQAELDIAINNPSASWHQQYHDSAYIFIGGLPYDLTEGDVISIFSQYGEVVDVNLPRANPNSRDKGNTADSDGAAWSSSSSQQPKPVGKGKHRGFGFLMYQDQRSTVLAVDNLNGAQVLGRTLRVDHVAAYKQPKVKDQEGNRVDAEVKSFNAAPPELGIAGGPDEYDNDAEQDADLDDPMAAYFQQRRREERDKCKHERRQPDDDEMKEKRRRKEERARIRAERQERRKHGSHSHSEHRRHRSDSHREQDDRDRKRHRPHRRQHDDVEGSQEAGLNRYEQMKMPRSVLDTDGSEARDSSSRPSRSRSRSRTPPGSSRHRSERSSRDPDARRDDKTWHHRHGERDSRRDHGRSGDSRRRSRSP